MNPVTFQLLRSILEICASQANRLAALEEEESRESAEEAVALQQAQSLLEQLTMGGVPAMPPGGIPTMPPGFVPSDI